MGIVATMKDGKVVVIDGKHRLLLSLQHSGSAIINLDGKETAVRLNEQNEIVLIDNQHHDAGALI